MNWGAGGTRTFRPLQGAEVNYLGPPSWVDPDWSPGSPTWVPAGSPLHRKAPEGPVPAPLREAEGAQETAAGAPCGQMHSRPGGPADRDVAPLAMLLGGAEEQEAGPLT